MLSLSYGPSPLSLFPPGFLLANLCNPLSWLVVTSLLSCCLCRFTLHPPFLRLIVRLIPLHFVSLHSSHDSTDREEEVNRR